MQYFLEPFFNTTGTKKTVKRLTQKGFSQKYWRYRVPEKSGIK